MTRRSLALVLVLAFHAAPAAAFFHLWEVSEVFSNDDGSVQFIEFFTTFDTQYFLADHLVETTRDGVMQAQFEIPTNLVVPPPDTANRYFLIATPGFAAVSGIAPDYELLAPGFLAADVDTVGLVGADSMSIAQPPLPRNGVDSLNEDLATLGENLVVAAATPTNFAGEVGVIVPESDGASLALAVLAAVAALKRRVVPRTR